MLWTNIHRGARAILGSALSLCNLSTSPGLVCFPLSVFDLAVLFLARCACFKTRWAHILPFSLSLDVLIPFGANRRGASAGFADQTRRGASQQLAPMPIDITFSKFMTGANWITWKFNWNDENHKSNAMKNCWVFYWYVFGACANKALLHGPE